jgi:hypothetical protein
MDHILTLLLQYVFPGNVRKFAQGRPQGIVVVSVRCDVNKSPNNLASTSAPLHTSIVHPLESGSCRVEEPAETQAAVQRDLRS